jgi:hypothetical protein
MRLPQGVSFPDLPMGNEAGSVKEQSQSCYICDCDWGTRTKWTDPGGFNFVAKDCTFAKPQAELSYLFTLAYRIRLFGDPIAQLVDSISRRSAPV